MQQIFVPLETVKDPDLVMEAIATALNLKDTIQTSLTLIDTVVAFVRQKSILLILDNFEQVVDAAENIAELLRKTQLLKILVTSRESTFVGRK